MEYQDYKPLNSALFFFSLGVLAGSQQKKQELDCLPPKVPRQITIDEAQAIFELNRFENELQDEVLDASNGETWKAGLCDRLTEYLGPQAMLITRLQKLSFKSRNLLELQNRKGAFRYLIQQAKNRIYARGLYIDPNKKNWFSSYEQKHITKAVWYIAGGILSLLVTCAKIGHNIGLREGEQNSKVEISDLKRDHQATSDSITELQGKSIQQEKIIKELQDSINTLLDPQNRK